ncbi:MAG TPA: outer membrane lipoprotein-sorting protein [Patescibacteria group bacterium]|nr:outer membrane lipoprotein-sorting protein [Patescibacteria group bacterium]
MKRIILAAAIAACVIGPACSLAQIAPAEIIQKVDDVRSPQVDYTIAVEVVSYLPNRAPKAARYEVMVKGPERTIIKTVFPETERGRILLMREKDLWAFFPDVSKPLRLSMQERLIGEVSNGDIARLNFAGDYDAKILREERIADKNYYVLELLAKNGEVTYAKVILWAEKETYWPLKAEFYALSGRLLKNCSYENYAMLAEKLRPTRLVMEDPITKGKKSVITYGDIRVGEIPEKYFAKDYMKKFIQ